LDPAKPIRRPYGESELEWLNVYLPYADTNLTLRLTDDPKDRPITAVFIVRPSPDACSNHYLPSMAPKGAVEISRNEICQGSQLMYDRFCFQYRVIRTNSSKPLLELTTPYVRLLFERIIEQPGKPDDAWAPVLGYSQELQSDLAKRYAALVAANRRSASPSVSTNTIKAIK
jgi:hypothetical protein